MTKAVHHLAGRVRTGLSFILSDMFRKLFITLLIAVVPVPFCGAQSKPSFEVATIRSSNAPPTEGYWSPPGTGKFIAHNLSLALLIHLAFGTDNRQIVNKPSWLESDRFDITAKPSEGVALSRDELKPRLQVASATALPPRHTDRIAARAGICAHNRQGWARNFNRLKAPPFPIFVSTSTIANSTVSIGRCPSWLPCFSNPLADRWSIKRV